VDESYFGGIRKGKRGRGKAGKIPSSASSQTRRQGDHRDDPRCPQGHAPSHHPAEGRSGFDRLYRLLSRLRRPRRLRVPTPQDRPLGRLHSRSPNHINGIDNFLNQAKRTLSRYNDIPKAHFPSFSRRPNFASTPEHPASNCEPSSGGPNSSPGQPDLGQPLPHLLVHRNDRSAHCRQILTNFQSMGVARFMTIGKQAFSCQRRQRLAYLRTLADHPKEATNYHFRSADFSRQYLLASLRGG
jgi:hypothetical protein